MKESNYQRCTDDNALFYTQVFCLQNESELRYKNVLGFVLGGLVIVQAAIFILSIEYFKKQTSEKYEEVSSFFNTLQYDQMTTTSSDYTVELKLNPEIYKDFELYDAQARFRRSHQDFSDLEGTPKNLTPKNLTPRRGLAKSTSRRRVALFFKTAALNPSKLFRFKLYLMNEIERILTARPYVIDDSINKIKIFDIVFGFKNKTLLQMLE